MIDTKKCVACGELIYRWKGDNDFRWTVRKVHTHCRSKYNTNKRLRHGTDTLHLNDYLIGKNWQALIDKCAAKGMGKMVKGGW